MVGIANYSFGVVMHAAVVRSFDAPPRYETFPTPQPSGEHEIAVDVLAAGLHPRVRSGASGSHYSSTEALPLIPGIDGVGRSAEGRLLYFVAFDGAFGTMAERTVVDRRRAVALADDADVAAVAAGMNPGMSSWLALRKRISLTAGQKVLVLGATGNAGRMAVQIAKFLDAARVTAAGRDAGRLAELRSLGADEILSLAGAPEDVARAIAAAGTDVDVVIDYLWGSVTEQAIPALVKGRSDPGRPLSWIEIGSMAGATITLPSAALRSANLQLLGSGQGSLTTAAIVAELPALADQLAAGTFVVDPISRPLSEVESAWDTPTAPGARIVFTT
jgi:NADPH:quinone reductase-like Zn-dependent oxidoreductase